VKFEGRKEKIGGGDVSFRMWPCQNRKELVHDELDLLYS